MRILILQAFSRFSKPTEYLRCMNFLRKLQSYGYEYDSQYAILPDRIFDELHHAPYSYQYEALFDDLSQESKTDLSKYDLVIIERDFFAREFFPTLGSKTLDYEIPYKIPLNAARRYVSSGGHLIIFFTYPNSSNGYEWKARSDFLSTFGHPGFQFEMSRDIGQIFYCIRNESDETYIFKRPLSYPNEMKQANIVSCYPILLAHGGTHVCQIPQYDTDFLEPYNSKMRNWFRSQNWTIANAVVGIGCVTVTASHLLSDLHLEYEDVSNFQLLFDWIKKINQRRHKQIVPPSIKENNYPNNSTKKIQVFISYCHQDKKYLKEDNLLGYLKGIEKEGVEFWYDDRIKTSELWDEKIKEKIKTTDIALVLVSQAFLNSRYCQEVEIKEFLDLRKEEGLRIFPIILSGCDWESYDWLKSTLFQPKEGKNIERHYTNPGKRKELFKEIMLDLRAVAEEITRAST